MTKEIYLIRHGETEWNSLGKGQGQEADVPLNDAGREQARRTGLYLEQHRMGNFDYIWASPMARARESAKIISQEIHFEGQIEFDSGLLERKYGRISGLEKTDPLRIMYNENKQKLTPLDPIEKYIRRDSAINELNKILEIGWENETDLESRTQKIIDKIVHSNCQKIMIVGHRDFLHAMIKKIFNIYRVPREKPSYYENCWISYLTYDSNSGFRLVSPPNTEHMGLV